MTYFKQALSAPALHFKRLKQAEPLYLNGRPIIRRIYDIVEAEIMNMRRRYLLLFPLKHEDFLRLEQFEIEARERSRGPMIEMRILYEEMMLVDSMGCKCYFDVILQELPDGMLLTEAVSYYRADDLREAVVEMKRRLDAIGFLHQHLRPSNILICNSGKARPLQYWHAKWEVFSNNDISQLLDCIERNNYPDSTRRPLRADAEQEEQHNSTTFEDITLKYKGGRYGFVDNDGRQITPYIYSWASNFCEGRAVVVRNNKVGVINSRGAKVINAIYNHIEFDVDSGFFIATNDKYRYIIDYEGKTISRTTL